MSFTAVKVPTDNRLWTADQMWESLMRLPVMEGTSRDPYFSVYMALAMSTYRQAIVEEVRVNYENRTSGIVFG